MSQRDYGAQGIVEIIESRPSRAALLRLKGQCAQLYGTIDKFQVTEVDAIQSVSTMELEEVEQLRTMRKQLNTATGALIDIVREQYRVLEELLQPQPVFDVLRHKLPRPERRSCIFTANGPIWVHSDLENSAILPAQCEQDSPPMANVEAVFTSPAVLFDCSHDPIGDGGIDQNSSQVPRISIHHNTHITTAVTVGHVLRSETFPPSTILVSVVCTAEGVWVSLSRIEISGGDDVRVEFSVKSLSFVQHTDLSVARIYIVLNEVLRKAGTVVSDVANVLMCNCRSAEDDANGDTLHRILEEDFSSAILTRVGFEEAMLCAGVGACYRHHEAVVRIEQEVSTMELGVEVWDGACVTMVNMSDVLPASNVVEIMATEERRLLRLCTAGGRPLHLLRIPESGRLLLRVSVLIGHAVLVELYNSDDQATPLCVLWDSREQPPIALFAPDDRRVEVLDASEYFKRCGNDALGNRDYATAVKHYSNAIHSGDPAFMHLYYSNRSAAYLYLSMPEKALEDANACIRANPDFAKGYSRQGHAFEQLGDVDAARKSYLTALAHDPENSQLTSTLESLEARAKLRAEKQAAAAAALAEANEQEQQQQRGCVLS